MSKRRAVITGLGPVSAIGIGKDQFRDALRSGTIGVDRITAFDPGEFRSQIGAEVRDLKCRQYVPKWYRKSTKVMARDIELAVVAADGAVRDGGLKTKGVSDDAVDVDPTRLGVNIGAGLICPDLDELTFALASAVENGEFSLARWGQTGMSNLTPLWLLKYLPNMLACHVSIIHDAQAPSNTITCAEASSQFAVGEAWRTIVRNAADVCLCGGAESKLNPMGLLRQDLAGRVTRTHNGSARAAVRPFDRTRDGTAVAEGGAVILLEELQHARKRNAKIYAELIGLGSAFGTDDFIRPDPDGRGISLAMEKALADAGLTPGDVDLVFAFACGLQAHDRAEAQAIRRTLGDVPVTAIRAQIGNNGAGTGALDVAAAALCLAEAFLPATANFKNPDPECPVNVVTQTRDARINVIQTISYSLSGGQVGSLLIRRWDGS